MQYIKVPALQDSVHIFLCTTMSVVEVLVCLSVAHRHVECLPPKNFKLKVNI